MKRAKVLVELTLEKILSIELEEKETKVKKAIDGFNPYCIFPGEWGPSDEYDGESRRISEPRNLPIPLVETLPLKNVCGRLKIYV